MPTIKCRLLPYNPFNTCAETNELPQPGDMFHHNPLGLAVVLPVSPLEVWFIQSKTNCGDPTPHFSCWKWSGEPPDITVDSACSTGAGSISVYPPEQPRYHAFLWHGDLIDIEQAKVDLAYFQSLTIGDQIKLKARTFLDAVRWEVPMRDEDLKQFVGERVSRVRLKNGHVLEGRIKSVNNHYEIMPVPSQSGVIQSFGPLTEFYASDVERID